jgi:hypothetical protein
MAPKNKPDYTKFMRKPAPIQMSPSGDKDSSGSPRRPEATQRPREVDIPWAEVIIEAEPAGEPITVPDRKETSTEGPLGMAGTLVEQGAPPVPVLALALFVLIVLMLE